MRFHLDEDLSLQIALRLRDRGLDVTTSSEQNLNQALDPAQLQFAASQGRCMVTRNRDDFIQATVEAFENLAPHAGVLIVPYSLPNNQFNRIAKALEAYSLAHPEGMQPYTVDFLSAGPPE